MTFNSPVFLFLFFPVFIAGYLLIGKRLRNVWLMVGSLIFYVWGEPIYFPVLVFSILVNHWLAGKIALCLQQEKSQRSWLVTGLVFNIGLLFVFKFTHTYWEPIYDFFTRQVAASSLDGLRGYLTKIIDLPLGISFYTFAMVSYLLDVANQRTERETSLFQLAQYVLLFPKLLAGPIATLRDIGGQLHERIVSAAGMADGMRRFIIGLSKKILIADQMAVLLDRGVLDLPPQQFGAGISWLLLLAYAVQIYFDFSGYTDMALGIGQMLGFKLPENFHYPYAARSITEFWRRWHITLSTWFREYLFYRLEIKRGRGRGLPQSVNILLVFLATGLWHGLTLNFAAWGLLHGAAIALESGVFGRWLKRAWRPLQHLYALVVIGAGWILFRTSSLPYAWNFLKSLLDFPNQTGILPFSVFQPVQASTWAALLAGVLLSVPLLPAAARKLGLVQISKHTWVAAIRDGFLVLLLLVCLAFIASSTYQPYIYGNF